MKRIYRPWTAWECYPAGLYESVPPEGVTPDDARGAYRDFLRDTPRFATALRRVLEEWPNSCEQFLSNESLNRVAWLGQAAMCITTGIPACFRGGFKLLTTDERRIANETARMTLNLWLSDRGVPSVRAGDDETTDQSICSDMETAWLFGRYPGRSTAPSHAVGSRTFIQGHRYSHSQKRYQYAFPWVHAAGF